MSGFDLTEFIKRIVKYLVEGLIVSIVALVIPKKSLNIEEVIILALSSAATFAVLDTFLPAVGASTKQGLGFSVGSALGGGLRIMG
jgi:ABC-type Co2+ transport system permease subunit